jgi:hypothetical protein
MKRLNGQFPPAVSCKASRCCVVIVLEYLAETSQQRSFLFLKYAAELHIISLRRTCDIMDSILNPQHPFTCSISLLCCLIHLRELDIMDNILNLRLMYIIWFYSSKAITWAMLHVFEVAGHLLYFLFLTALLIYFSFNVLTLRNWKEEKKLHPEVYYFLCMYVYG